MEFDFKNWTDEALQDFLSAAKEEQRRRKEERKEFYWNPVKQAIADYNEKVGEITFFDGGCIHYISQDNVFCYAGQIR